MEKTSENSPTSGTVRNYGWKKDKVDHRDLFHNFFISKVHASIKHVDLRNMCPPVYDQGELGSCTANAIAGAYQFDEIKEKEQSNFTPSRLFIYYNERKLEGSVNVDAGAEIRDGIKTINQIGVCPETLWPYDISKFKDEPPANCYDVAKNHKSVEYKQVLQDLQQMKQCLINGYPFVIGISVYESFESKEVAKTGTVPMPKHNEKFLGGHAMLCVSYDDNKKVFGCRNSWGSDWADKGNCYLPYEYLLDPNLASDFWTVTKVVDTPNQ
jgi:C1A family cysteine protease